MTSESNLQHPVSAPQLHSAEQPSTEDNDAQIIGQIRSILVGPQLLAVEERFRRVEEMVLTHNSRLLNLLDKRIALLEEQIEHRATGLQTALEVHQTTSKQAISELDQQLQRQSRELRSEFDELSTAMAQAHRALRQALDDEVASLRQGAQNHDQDLANLFQDMAARLLKSDRG